ncbi:uncharacterized protein LOC119101851 [Pollicipes pollicipes]|uniref:uncharacterized protein LOC119101851 n=1 Tax=Pollicipes pollicipes TaxID=41117 RepID=UPI0018857B2B|nr:uncharacterized protein LOC119101851 [Pollicipes pollicipes]
MSECLLILITGLFLFRGTYGTGDHQGWQRDIARGSNAYGVEGRLSGDRPLRGDGRQRLLPLGFVPVGPERRLETGPHGGGSAGGVAPGGGGQPLGPVAPVVGRSPKPHAARGLAPDSATEEISLRLTVVTPRSGSPASGDRQDGRGSVSSDGLTQGLRGGDILGAQQSGEKPAAAVGGQEIVLGFQRNSAQAGGEEGETDIAPKQSKTSSAMPQLGPPLGSDQASEASRKGSAVSGPGHPAGVTSEQNSGFDCRRQQMDGFYADISDEARCQAFWVCHNKQQDGFLCPNGTVFNQRYLTCDWWFNVQCDESPQHFDLNRNISVVGTHISAQPAGMPAGAAPRVHPVLTMLGDILKYPGVPPVPPSNSTAPSNKSAPTAPASQAATPSSSQQPYDFELDVANVFVVGGIPGIPPLDTQCGDHLQSKATDHTACSLNRQPTKGPKLTNKRHAKRSSAYIHKRPYKRDLGNTKTTKHLHRRKARDSFMVQAAKGLESATSMLSSRIPQVERSAISQLHKRATSPSPAPAALPSALAEPPDQGAAANQAGPQPIVQTVDKIAFPLAPNGGNLPKVEEDFKIQGMGGDGRATSIKDVMPSHFPVPGALKVMAASGKEVPYGSMASAPPSQTGSQQSPTGPAQENGSGRDYASISLAQDVDFGQGSKGGSGEGAAEDGARSGRSGSPNGQTAVSGFLASPVATAAQPPAPGNAAGLNDGSNAQDASAPSPPRASLYCRELKSHG